MNRFNVNLFSVGFQTLLYKETLRFWKVATQTVAAPVLTAMLYLLIFGHVLEGRVDEPKGDPGNTLSREEITAKALRLAAFSGGAGEAEMRDAIGVLWRVAEVAKVGPLLGAKA